VYSLKEDKKRRFLFALRTSIPVVALTLLLVFASLKEQNSLWYNLFLLFLGFIASLSFIFFMMFENKQERILDEISLAFNRKFFEKFLKRELKPNSAILLISIDNIKEINERYGIENGDKILRKFAQLLDRYFPNIPIGRVKAGDFLLFFKGKEGIKEKLDNFLKKYNHTFIDNIEIKLVGVYEVFEKGTVKSLIDRAYEQLYYCQEECKKEKIKRKDEDVIVESLKKHHFSLLYQPILNLHTNSFEMVEVIVKLVDEKGGFIHPSQFVPVVNRLGLENEFDLALTRKILEEIKSYSLPTTLNYNFHLSPYSVRNKSFSKQFFNLVERIEPSSMVIELFETGVYRDVEFYKKILKEYKRRGFKLAFDNFGACNASIEYIKNIEVDFIHFDKFFTKRINRRNYEILLKSWIEAFRKLGIKTVVKFIDNEELIEQFKKLEVDYLQGFKIATPLNAKELKKFLGERYEVWRKGDKGV